jgi:hypothetical protein
MYPNKRRNGEISTGENISSSNESVYYDTNITVSIPVDSGAHGRPAVFSDTRVLKLIPQTDKYTVALVRGNITTDNFPLFIPLLRPSTPGAPNPVIENGQALWETAVQPGLALTWTGPVYAEGAAGTNVLPAIDSAIASWPTYGYIYVYTNNQHFAPLNLGAVSSWPDVLAATAATRLNALFTAAGISLSVAISGVNNQFYTFTNSATVAYNLDFSLPPSFQQLNQGGVPSSKAGILQACKLLGFIPGQVFTVAVGATTPAPRPFQMGLRTTLNLYSYKNVRWTPEDTGVASPSSQEVASGYLGSYFDCYSYEHFLNECVNPTFRRCIYDQWETTAVPGVALQSFAELSLQRQLSTLCQSNCSATQPWSNTTLYTPGQSVHFEGRAYYCVDTNVNISPTRGSGEVNPDWVDAGPSIIRSWSPNASYAVGDLVTYAVSRPTYYICGTAHGPSPTFSFVNFITATNMTSNATIAIRHNIPAIGSLPPTITFNPSSQLFVLNLDSYGSGGTGATNVDDGYFGFIDDSLFPQNLSRQLLNAALNDQARDSWGMTGTNISTPAYTSFRHPNIVYDERIVVEADDYFNQLFGNWPTIRLTYIDPRTSVVTSYVRYNPQAATAGLTVPTPLPLLNPTVATTGYLPLTRVAGNQPYLYTFTQQYPSVGLAWNPIDTIVVSTGNVPSVPDQTVPPFVISDTVSSRDSNQSTRNILGEFVVKSSGTVMSGQEYRNQIIFEPQHVNRVDLIRGVSFNNFDFKVEMRMKVSQLIRTVFLSHGGSVNIRWHFELKA